MEITAKKMVKKKKKSRSGLSFKEFLKNQTSLTIIKQFFCLRLTHTRCSPPSAMLFRFHNLKQKEQKANEFQL